MEKYTLYTLGSPNGIKIPIAMEEMNLHYNIKSVDITKNEQFKPSFVKINPRSKIPVLIDESFKGKDSLVIAESCAILLYLADKHQKLISQNPAGRAKTIEWLFYQASTEGPTFGAYGHFSTYAKDKVKDPYPRERYLAETEKVLDFINGELDGQEYLVENEYSIADISMFPWVVWIKNFYNIENELELSQFPNVMEWVSRCCQREKTKLGLETYHYLSISNN
ncbi:MAG TPA: glutathione S-transferase [Vibrio sp.]|nr:glutathione S-transferase [Vibrio sp.]